MKGEYRDDKTPPNSMFSKFHHHHPNHHQQPQQPPPSQHFAITNHHFQLSNTSEEADSPTNTTTQTTQTTQTTLTKHVHVSTTPNPNDGASIETLKRPRGRPPGSKNKPKPPIVITREPDPAMSPYVLELPANTDIIDAVGKYCRKRNTGLCILTGSGTVSNVSLRQPSTTSGGTVTFHGRFDILSISATVFPSSSPFANAFTISLAGPQGQIVGGPVAGPLMSAGPVYIIAASFNNPMYHRLPAEEENSGGASGSVAASDQSPPPPPGVSTGGDSGGGHHQAPPVTDSMSMYSSHLPSDVIWAPTARQAQLHPPPY